MVSDTASPAIAPTVVPAAGTPSGPILTAADLPGVDRAHYEVLAEFARGGLGRSAAVVVINLLVQPVCGLLVAGASHQFVMGLSGRLTYMFRVIPPDEAGLGNSAGAAPEDARRLAGDFTKARERRR